MRGFGPRSLILNLPNPLTPTLSPLGRGSSLSQPLRNFMTSTSVLAARLGARVFRRAIENGARLQECGHVKRETGSVQGKGRGGACLSVFRYSDFVRSIINEGSGTPANAGHQPPHLMMRRAPNGARTLAGVPPRLSPRGIIPSQRLSFRPGFLGLGLYGRYPPSPVPVQGCTSRPGRNAGRHDARAAREQAANPPAGTALAPMTRCASAPCPSKERGLYSNCIRDDCQEGVSEKDTPRF